MNNKSESNKNRSCACAGHKHSGTGCKCHEHGHSHGHSAAQSKVMAIGRPGISFAILLAGLILNYAGAEWFACNSAMQLVWYVIAFIPVGLPVMKEAWASIVHGDVFNEFTLMVIACVGAFCIGEYPEAVGVMLFYCIGEEVQHLAVDKATRNISRLLDVRGESAHVMRNGKYVEISPKDVKIGDMMEVRPGERVSLDGVLCDDYNTFDTSALTGESVPRTIDKGGEVLAGMISSSGIAHIRVTKEYGKSALARILELVNEASGRKAPAEQFIRRFARIYTPVVTGLAVLLIAIPALVGALSPSFHFVLDEWVYRALVFLVISCPCALVISVPLGYFAGIGAASKAGILFKGGNYLDAITRIDSVAFDKTGTMTIGKFHVDRIHAENMGERDLLNLVAAVESGSTHPIAKAIVEAAGKSNLQIPEATQMKEYSGLGAEAMVGAHKVIAGNIRMLSRFGINYPTLLEDVAYSSVVCAVDGKYAGYILVADTLKNDAGLAVSELHSLGIKKIILLSGDRKKIVEDCGKRLGTDEAFGELMPQDKAAVIDKAVSQGHRIAFVGDGLNDAPVLALSNVGVAMGGLGSDAAIESADVVIQTDEPSKMAEAIRIGRYTRKIVTQNIVGAISIKVIILVLGAIGYASLWAAVFADVGVALLAVCNSMRILVHRFDKKTVTLQNERRD